jgi:hypothetical protein
MVEANGTLEPTLDSGKSDGVDGAIIIAASRWLGLLVFLVIIVLLLSHLLLGISFLWKGTSLAFKDLL